MESEIRAVIDTNVAVSAVLLPCSVPRQAFDAAARGRLLVSEATITEFDLCPFYPGYAAGAKLASSNC